MSFSPVTTRWASVVVIPTSSRAELGGLHRARPHLVAEGEAEARTIRQPHPAVANLDALLEEWVEPFEVLDPRLGGVGRGKV